MRRRHSILAVTALCLLPAAASPAGSVFIVRHAEKASDANGREVALSAAGEERAKRLAAMLRDARIAAIYSTDTVRTLSTAEPLARAARLKPEIYDPAGPKGAVDLAPLAERIRKQHPADNVLVVGHSNTLAPLIGALGVAEEVTVGHDDYDGVYVVVVPERGGAPVLLRLRS